MFVVAHVCSVFVQYVNFHESQVFKRSFFKLSFVRFFLSLTKTNFLHLAVYLVLISIARV